MAAAASAPHSFLIQNPLSPSVRLRSFNLSSKLPIRPRSHPFTISCTAVRPPPAPPSVAKERIFNFAAGPATLPESVILKAQSELYNYRGSGMSIMEMSHRGKEFDGVIKKAESDLRLLLSIPDDYTVLILQGGATTQFASVVTGSSDKAFNEAQPPAPVGVRPGCGSRNLVRGWLELSFYSSPPPSPTTSYPPK